MACVVQYVTWLSPLQAARDEADQRAMAAGVARRAARQAHIAAGVRARLWVWAWALALALGLGLGLGLGITLILPLT